MAFDFTVERDYQDKLDWADEFVRDHVEPLDLAFPHQEFNRPTPKISPHMGIVDGPTEVHQVTISRQVLEDYRPLPDEFPTAWLPPRIEAARERFAEALEHQVGNL